jgi:hypothetical protein
LRLSFRRRSSTLDDSPDPLSQPCVLFSRIRRLFLRYPRQR